MSAAPTSYERIAFVASPVAEAQEACELLRKTYGDVSPDNADIVVALGGDGFMLHTLHTFMTSGKPIYGMHRGTVGFLMNEFSPTNCPHACRLPPWPRSHPPLWFAPAP